MYVHWTCNLLYLSVKDDGGPYFPEDGVAGELSAFQACFLLRWPQIADTDIWS